MSGSRSKTKGSSWEREIAKYLSEQHAASFIRAPHSGAYIGGTNVIRRQTLDQSQIKRSQELRRLPLSPIVPGSGATIGTVVRPTTKNITAR
jgi:hypothetical protein